MAKGDAAYLEFDDRPLYFECVTSEQADQSSTATEFAVEEGANMTDHVRPQADRVTLEVLLSNTPITDPNGWYGGSLESVELEVPTFDKPLAPTPGALINSALDALSSLIDGKPTYKAQVTKYSIDVNQPKDVLELLDAWRLAAKRGKVILPWKTYESMIITHVGINRTATTGDAAAFTIELQQIRVVASELVTAPAETRALPAVSKGRQPTSIVREPADKKKSVFRALEELYTR